MSPSQPLPFPTRIPFAEHLGLALHALADGQSELRVDIREALCNSRLVAHGGVLMTLLDVAMAHAARSTHGDDGPGVVTIEMKTSFLRPGTGRLRAVGRVLRKATSMAFCEGSVFDDAGELVAHATGTFKLLRDRAPAAAA